MISRVVTVSLFLALLGCSSADEAPDTGADAGKTRVRNFWAMFRQANRARVEGNLDEAIAGYREALSMEPKHEEALFYLGVGLEYTGRYREAVLAFEQLIELNPNSGRALSQLAELLSTPAPGAPLDLERAEALLRRLIEVNREQAGPFLLLGKLRLNQGDWKSASENFLLAAATGAPEGYAWAGYTAYLQGDRESANAHFGRASDRQRRERELAGAGVRAEGDMLPAADKPLNALDRAALIAAAFLEPIQADNGGGQRVLEPFDAGIASNGRGAWGDLNGDGRPDLAVGGERLRLYLNSSVSFLDATDESRLSGLGNIGELLWMDYDSDGRPDLYISGGNGVQLLRNLDGRHFEDATGRSSLGGNRDVLRALAVDLNADGEMDLVETGAAAEDSSPVRLYRNRGGIFSPSPAPPVSGGQTIVDAASADFDGDGRADLVLACWRRGIRVFLQRDGGAWQESQSISTGVDAFSVVVLDYDRDGSPDVLAGTHASWEDSLRSLRQPMFRPGSGAPLLLRNTGRGTFENVTKSAGLDPAFGIMQALAADFDLDGWIDLLFANGSLDSCRLEASVILRNENGRRFTLWQRIPADGRNCNMTAGAVEDFDRDGDPDVFLSPNAGPLSSVASGGLFRNTLHPPLNARE